MSNEIKIIFRSLLLVTIFFTSCNGQVKTTLSKDSATITTGQPKIIKTQGTDQFDNICCMLQDKAGNIWFGTTGEGVYRYDGNSFTQFTVKDGLNFNVIWSIFEDKTGIIWFGTADGVCRYDGKKFTVMPIFETNSNTPFSYNSHKNKISVNSYGNPSEENSVWSIIQDKAGTIWFGTTDGIYTYDGKSFTHFLHNDGIVNNTRVAIKKVESILVDKTGKIWFGGRGTNGLFCYDGKTISHFAPDGDNWVRPVFEDRTGILWFARRKFSWYSYDRKTFTNFADNEFHSWVLHMAEDKRGNLWFSTEDGIVYYDGKSFTRYGKNEGFKNADITSLIIDRSGNLWIGTRNVGLYRYDGKTFTSFSEEKKYFTN